MALDKLTILSRFQQLILQNNDISNLFNSLPNQVLTDLSVNGIDYQFFGFIITVGDNIQRTIMLNRFQDGSLKPPVVDQNQLQQILKDNQILKNCVVIGRTYLLQDLSPINSLLQLNADTKTVVICPIQTANFNMWLILSTSRAQSELASDELELVELLSDTMGIVYRMQDTQLSLTSITQEVYKMNAKLHQLDKLKDDFVSVASHELRTPMTAIRSYSWMALYRSDIELSAKMKKYLERIHISTERLINLVNDMLNISRIESGRIEVTPVVFEMSKLIADVMTEIGPKASEKNLHLQVMPGNVPHVFADPDKVHQVLLNLLGNSLKFTPVEGAISVSFFADGINLDISIKDTGVGISKEDVSRLFQKFGRLDNSYVASATSGGTGLGLYICRKLVEVMGGKIWANSPGEGQGTTFTFSLPIATDQVIAHAASFTHHVEGEAKALEPTAI